MLTDSISLFLLVGWIVYGITDSLVAPRFIEESELGARYWAACVSRLICPVGFLWFAGLAIGKGVTASILSRKIIVEWLAPSSYNMFLFHQPISELYFLATRGIWWAYPKSFYWFSPYPIPVKAWEIPIVMIIVIIFSMVMHFYVNQRLITLSTSFLLCFRKRGSVSSYEGTSVANIVKQVIAQVSHIDPSNLTDETNLTDIGISSMTLPVAISQINMALKSSKSELSLSSKNAYRANSVNDLVALANEEKEPRRNISMIWSSRHSAPIYLGGSRHSAPISLGTPSPIESGGNLEDELEEGIRF